MAVVEGRENLYCFLQHYNYTIASVDAQEPYNIADNLHCTADDDDAAHDGCCHDNPVARDCMNYPLAIVWPVPVIFEAPHPVIDAVAAAVVADDDENAVGILFVRNPSFVNDCRCHKRFENAVAESLPLR